jgi:hypothetical protein
VKRREQEGASGEAEAVCACVCACVMRAKSVEYVEREARRDQLR